MARDPSLLDSHQPVAIAPAQPVIAHVQLRDLLICPREQGVVNYIVPRAIVEQDMHAPGAPTRVLSHLSFTPISLTSLPVGENDTLIAAGGQEREIHLSLYTPRSTTSSSSTSSSTPTTTSAPYSRRTRQVWEHEDKLQGSINNSVLLTSLSLTRAHESSVEPRVGVSNNDGTVRLYDVPMRVQSAKRKLRLVGEVRLDVAINHSSISPDGRTLLSVGDSNKIYFHQLSGSSSLITFSPITTLSIPPPDFSPFSSSPTLNNTTTTTTINTGAGAYYHSSSLTASFSTAFSGDGSKFAVASQEGVVGVWDVRFTGKPLKVWQTDKTRGMHAPSASSSGSSSSSSSGSSGSYISSVHSNGASGSSRRGPGAGGAVAGGGSGTAGGSGTGIVQADIESEGLYAAQRTSWWLSDDPWEWTRSRAPGWCARSVKFSRAAGAGAGVGARERGAMGREVMAFTEHTSLVHVVDARTFETHDIVRVPTLFRPVSSSTRDPNALPPRRAPSATTTAGATTSGSTAANGAGASGTGTAAGALDGLRRRALSDGAAASSESAAAAASAVGGSGGGSGRAQRVLMRRGLPVSNTRTRAGSRAGASAGGEQSTGTGTSARQSVRSPAAAPGGGGGSSTVNDATATAASGSSPSPNVSLPPPPPPASLDFLHPPIRVSEQRRQEQLQLQNQNRAQNQNANQNAPQDADQNQSQIQSQTQNATLEGQNQAPTHPSTPLRSSNLPSSAVPASSSSSSPGGRSGLVSPQPQPQTRTPLRSTTTTRPPSIGIVQALGDAFRIPLPSSSGSGSDLARPITPTRRPGFEPTAAGGISRTSSSSYSPPASIGDSTWRTLGGGAIAGRSWSPPVSTLAQAGSSAGTTAAAGSSSSSSSSSSTTGPSALNTNTAAASAWTVDPRPSTRNRDRERAERMENWHVWARLAVQELGRVDMEPWRREALEARLARGFVDVEHDLADLEAAHRDMDTEEEEEEEEEEEPASLEGLIAALRRGDVPRRPERPRLFRARQEEERRDEEEEGIVVVPDLGDPSLQSEVHALLAGHGFQSRLATEGDDRDHDGDQSSVTAASSVTAHTPNTTAAATTASTSRARTRTRSPSPTPTVGPEDVNRLFEEVIQRRRARAQARAAARRIASGAGTGTESASEYAWIMADSSSSEDVGGVRGRGGQREEQEDVDMMDVDEIEHDHDRAHTAGDDTDIVIDVEEEDSDGDDHPIYGLGAALAGLTGSGVGNVRVDEDVFATDLEYVDGEESGERRHLPMHRRLGFHHYMEEDEEEEGEDDLEEEEEYRHDEDDGEDEVDGEDQGYTARRGIRQGGASSGGAAVSTSSRYSSARRTTSSNADARNKHRLTSKASSLSSAASRRYGYYEDLDLAGMCFDPWGERMYVAGVGMGVGGDMYGGGWGSGAFDHGHGRAAEGMGVGAVVEWGVRGAEKRWWVDDGWM